MATLPKTRYTPEEYLEMERKAEYKSEYFDGEIFAMSGASRKHNDVAMQLALLIGQHLSGTTCSDHNSDMRVRVSPKSYTYPDLTVVCGERRFEGVDLDTLVNPTLIFEILSPTTEVYDRGRKADLYREIESLQQLVLVAQDRYEVEISTRQHDGSWSLRKFRGLDASVDLSSIGYTLSLRDLYRRVIEQAV
jgi:Uma2 family endonuclease